MFLRMIKTTVRKMGDPVMEDSRYGTDRVRIKLEAPGTEVGIRGWTCARLMLVRLS